MKLSTDRILTTHTGSLPRAEDLTATLEALDSGRMPDPAAFDTRVRRARPVWTSSTMASRARSGTRPTYGIASPASTVRRRCR